MSIVTVVVHFTDSCETRLVYSASQTGRVGGTPSCSIFSKYSIETWLDVPCISMLREEAALEPFLISQESLLMQSSRCVMLGVGSHYDTDFCPSMVRFIYFFTDMDLCV